ncbi:MAG: type II toxin-antitoxin system VapC family toxin [Nitrospirae bacterium]|nr:type II toxin-antitoxin system VapC family toxin [Nitrospirota bacterium]
MVLVDTSVWVLHLRESNFRLERLLDDGDVVCHPFIVGELACGNLKNRTEILSLLHSLPMATQAENEDVMKFIENYRLMGKGLGYIDMHLLASAILTGVPIWTFDKKLGEVSAELGIDLNTK